MKGSRNRDSKCTVVFSVVKSSICFVEHNSHDSLQACLIEGIGNQSTSICNSHVTKDGVGIDA